MSTCSMVDLGKVVGFNNHVLLMVEPFNEKLRTEGVMHHDGNGDNKTEVSLACRKRYKN